MVKLIIFALLIVIIINAFNLDISFITEGFSLIVDQLGDIPYIIQLTQDILANLLEAPVIRTLILFGLSFIIIKWLINLVGDNDEEHKYKE